MFLLFVVVTPQKRFFKKKLNRECDDIFSCAFEKCRQHCVCSLLVQALSKLATFCYKHILALAYKFRNIHPPGVNVIKLFCP